MSLAPEYDGDSSWRMILEPPVYAKAELSGDHTTPQMSTSSWATCNSTPSARERVTRLLPCGDRSAAAGVERTKAMRVPSGDGTGSAAEAGVFHAGRGAPPVMPTFHRSPAFGK